MAPTVFFYSAINRLATAARGRRGYRTLNVVKRRKIFLSSFHFHTTLHFYSAPHKHGEDNLKSLSQNRFECIFILVFSLFFCKNSYAYLCLTQSPFNSSISTARFKIKRHKCSISPHVSLQNLHGCTQEYLHNIELWESLEEIDFTLTHKQFCTDTQMQRFLFSLLHLFL